ncbi:MAG: helix-turn-helix transcriptional regulator [Clostridium sp.]|nr:helix-turn-helix transcriptional regulator [Clostridium sp.]
MTIAEARKSKGMSRKDVAEWLEIPYRTITNWENGERQCPAYMEKLIVEKILSGQAKGGNT